MNVWCKLSNWWDKINIPTIKTYRKRIYCANCNSDNFVNIPYSEPSSYYQKYTPNKCAQCGNSVWRLYD
jgi:hypothetical protein